MKQKTKTILTIVAIVLVLLAIIGGEMYLGNFTKTILTLAGINVVLTLSLNLINGFTGRNRLLTSSEEISEEVEQYEKGGEKYRKTKILTPGGSMSMAIKYNDKVNTEWDVEYFIKDKGDFEQFAKYQPKEIRLDCSRMQRARRLVGDAGITVHCSHGAFNTLNMYRRLDDMMTDPYMDEGLYREMMAYFTGRAVMLLTQIARAGADAINPAINMATGSAVGPAYFRKFIKKTLYAGTFEKIYPEPEFYVVTLMEVRSSVFTWNGIITNSVSEAASHSWCSQFNKSVVPGFVLLQRNTGITQRSVLTGKQPETRVHMRRIKACRRHGKISGQLLYPGRAVIDI
jgi:hypothetical protein